MDQALNDQEELPVFPAQAPDVFSDTDATIALVIPILDSLADVVSVPEGFMEGPTPCQNFTVAELQRHVLAWLQFFAAALNDPDGRTERLEPEAWKLGDGADPSGIVRAASRDLITAIENDVAERLVVMSQARMPGDAVVAMALGEYIVHGWDLATATGRAWSVDDEAADHARTFLEGTVSPEYRGPDSGFFDYEVAVPDDAAALDRLLGFAGRDPNWNP